MPPAGSTRDAKAPLVRNGAVQQPTTGSPAASPPNVTVATHRFVHTFPACSECRTTITDAGSVTRRPALVPPTLPRLISATELHSRLRHDPDRQPDGGSPGGTDLGPVREAVRVRRDALIEIPSTAPPFERDRRIHLGRAVAAHRRMQTTHVFALQTAALVHGLRVWQCPSTVAVIVRRDGAGNERGHVRRIRADIAPEDVTEVSGLPVTTLERTIVDCARYLHPRDALVPADHYLQVVTHADPADELRVEEEIAGVLARLRGRIDDLGPRARGVRQARAVLRWATPWAESAWETQMRWIVLTWGCRTVRCQVRVLTRTGTYRTDLGIPVGRRTDGSVIWLHIEFDGRGKYGYDANETSEVVLKERRRQLAIERTGDLMVRFTAAEAWHPQPVVARIIEAFGRYPSPALDPVVDLLPRGTPPHRARTAD